MAHTIPLLKHHYTYEVIDTSDNCQTVLYHIPTGTTLPERILRTIDQLVVVVQGHVTISQKGKVTTYTSSSITFVPKGSRFRVENNGTDDVTLMVYYAPPFFSCGVSKEFKPLHDKSYVKYYHYYYSTN